MDTDEHSRLEAYEPPIPASSYAAREGVTVDAIVKRVQRGKLRGQKIAGEWWVSPPKAQIEVPAGGLVLPEDTDGQLGALAVYNRRLIEPWAERVGTLEGQVIEANREIGDLRRQVRQLKREVDGMRLAMIRALKGGDEG